LNPIFANPYLATLQKLNVRTHQNRHTASTFDKWRHWK